MTNDIREMLAARPFQPFMEHTADGREYNVSTPKHAHVSPRGGRVSILADDDTTIILPGLLITGLKIPANARRKK